MTAEQATLTGTITCPHCRAQHTQSMPTDSCLYFFACGRCGAMLKPKPGDCCVFCSYGSVPCPPIQLGRGDGGCGCKA